MPEKTISLKIESVANLRENWRKRAHRAKEQRGVCRMVARAMVSQLAGDLLPCVVTLTRIAPRSLDAHDNLRSSLKGVVDGVSDALGVTDNDPRITWRYAQERGKPREYALRIRIEQA